MLYKYQIGLFTNLIPIYSLSNNKINSWWLIKDKSLGAIHTLYSLNNNKA